MPVTAPGEGDAFRITVIKYHTNNPDRKWANNYEVKASEASDTATLIATGVKLADFEKHIHLDVVKFDRLRISTWEPDSTPYDPTTFISLPLSGAGLVSSSGQNPLALNVCLNIGRVPSYGRFGFLYYRGALLEFDVDSPAGKFKLTNPTQIDTRVSDAIDDTAIDGLLAGGGDPFTLVMVRDDPATARDVTLLSPRGVVVVPFDHAWFNRTP
jgi:hypothetical protein